MFRHTNSQMDAEDPHSSIEDNKVVSLTDGLHMKNTLSSLVGLGEICKSSSNVNDEDDMTGIVKTVMRGETAQRNYPFDFPFVAATKQCHRQCSHGGCQRLWKL